MWVWILFIVAIIYLSKTSGKKKRVKKIEKEVQQYYKKDSFFTKKELDFYKDLTQYINGDLLIFSKVGIKDFVGVKKGLGQEGRNAFLKISQKHIDFLLVDPLNFEPILGIELDGYSHMGRENMERDLFVNKLYADIDFDLIRFNNAYKKEEIPYILDQFVDHYRRNLLK